MKAESLPWVERLRKFAAAGGEYFEPIKLREMVKMRI